MKKIMIMLTFLVLLVACSHPILKRQSTVQIGKTVKENNVKYRNAEIGHSSNIVAETNKDEFGSFEGIKIHIPIKYTENISSLPKKLPSAFSSIHIDGYIDGYSNGIVMEKTESIEPKQFMIYSNDKELLLNVEYWNCWEKWGNIFISPYFPFGIILTPLYLYACNQSSTSTFESSKSWKIVAPPSFAELNSKNLGISINITYYPNELYLSCEKKDCMIVDKNNRPVNKVYIHKELKVDQKRINELILKEKEEKERRAKEEAEKERKEKIAYRKWYKEADAVCPTLIQQVQHMQVNPYAYNIKVKKGIIYSYRKYDCAQYASIVASELY